MNRSLLTSLSCLLLLAGCGPDARKTQDPEPVTVSKASHALLRVENAVAVPAHYKGTLRLDPAQSTFSGQLEIALSVAEPTADFYLNGYGLQVSEASISSEGGETTELRVTNEDEHWLHFAAERPLPAGSATLRLVYEGAVSATSSFGIFRQKAAEDWYLFTQFEARGARRAFPSLDQPDQKVPWQLSLEVPEGMVALTNSPETGREDLGDGFVRVHFAESPPMPSYLVAFAVGAFDVVDIGKTRSDVPVRVVAPRGRGGETAWVQQSTLRLIEILEDYTGIPYPYAKLDLISIPSTGSFGAMENPGLITYTETLLLSKDNDLNFKKRSVSVQAHEFAHQWFGNLVTNAWWDDLWLNESFATWAAPKVVGEFNPEWQTPVSKLSGRGLAMNADKLASARIIHEPVKSEGDIGAAFDGITYAKGAAVLRMFEGWLGEEKFQRGIQHYLASNQWKSLTAQDFFDAMDQGTGENVSESFATFIDNPGTPTVSFELACSAGGAVTLKLSHERYKPLGSEISESPAYQIPVCVRYPTGKGSETSRGCTMVSGSASEMTLDAAQSCPAWIVPNDGGTGYYRSELSESLRDALAEKAPLSTMETLIMASDRKAMVWAGRAPIEGMLALVPEMAASKDEGLISTAADLANLGRLVEPKDASRYQVWLRKHFGRTAVRLGWKTGANEPPSRTALREKLLPLMIFEAGDRKLRGQANDRAQRWLKKPESVDPNVAEIALRVGARYGDKQLLDAYVAAIKGTSSRSRRRLLLSALGEVTEPELVKHALTIMLDTEVDVRESQSTLTALAGHKESGHLALEFVEANFDALIKRYGEEMGARLRHVASSQCDESRVGAVETFLRERILPMENGKRASEQALEQFRLCLAARKSIQLPPVL